MARKTACRRGSGACLRKSIGLLDRDLARQHHADSNRPVKTGANCWDAAAVSAMLDRLLLSFPKHFTLH
jgi:hypothetical protein